MDHSNNLDELIIKSLKSQTDEIKLPAGMLERIQSKVNLREEKKSGNPNRWYFRNKMGLAFGILIMLCVFCSAFSKDARAIAITAIEKVKSIFVLEKDKRGYRVVKKPAAEVGLMFSVSRTTRLSDPKISNKVGYPVCFPKALAFGYTLKDKTLGVILNKEIHYELGNGLSHKMKRAIEDDREFKKLSVFKPQRDICGIYKDRHNNIIFINIVKPWGIEALPGPAVTFGREKIKANWIESPLPIYPLKKENGDKSEDLTKKPADIKITHSLYWEYTGIGYSLHPFYTKDLTLDEALKIADSFIKGQKRIQLQKS